MRLNRVLLLVVLVSGGLLWLNSRSSKREAGDSAMESESSLTPQSSKGREMAAQRLASRKQKASSTPSVASTNRTIFQRILAEDQTLARLSREQIEAFLLKHQTNASSLLTAWMGGADPAYLKLAAEMYPDDPRVQLAVVNVNLYPEQQREWLDRLKKFDPDNSIGNYLSARDYLRTGQPELAMKDLTDAAGKGRYEDYTKGRLQDLEEIQIDSGHSAAEAKALAGGGLQLPQLGQLRDLASQLGTLQKKYLRAGDPTTAEQIAHLGEGVSRELSGGKGGASLLIGQMVGLAMEKNLLGNLPANSEPGFLGMSVQQRLDQIADQRQQITSLMPQFALMIGRGNESEIIGYFERMKANGETAALQWLASGTP